MVRKCPKCGSVWYTDLIKCAFCGVEGEEVKGPISPAKLNINHGGVSAGPKPGEESSVVVKPDEERPPAAAAPEPPPPPPPPKPAVSPVERPEPVAVEPPPPPSVAALRPVVKAPEPPAPAPQIPSAVVPLVFGALGLVACLLLPLVGAVQHNRVVVILSLLAWSILAPFAPFAWFAGQRYLDQCRSLGFVPASSAATGKTLGKLATFVIVFEFSALSVFVAIQALSGKIVCPLWK